MCSGALHLAVLQGLAYVPPEILQASECPLKNPFLFKNKSLFLNVINSERYRAVVLNGGIHLSLTDSETPLSLSATPVPASKKLPQLWLLLQQHKLIFHSSVCQRSNIGLTGLQSSPLYSSGGSRKGCFLVFSSF